MGIIDASVCFEVSEEVTQEEWEPVYEKALLLIQSMGLAEKRVVPIHGISVTCLEKAAERSRKVYEHLPCEYVRISTRTGCYISGDYESMRTAETFYLPRNIENIYRIRYKENSHYYRIVWDEKTQGEPYHNNLLKIASLFVDCLGEKVHVYDSIMNSNGYNCQDTMEAEYRDNNSPENRDMMYSDSLSRYSINTYRELINYKEGDSIHPELLHSIRESCIYMKSLLTEEEYGDLKEQSPQTQFEWIILQNPCLLIRDRDWKKIYTDMKKHKRALSRYYPLMKLEARSSGHIDFIKAMLVNDELYQYCKKKRWR